MDIHRQAIVNYSTGTYVYITCRSIAHVSAAIQCIGFAPQLVLDHITFHKVANPERREKSASNSEQYYRSIPCVDILSKILEYTIFDQQSHSIKVLMIILSNQISDQF